MSDEAQKIASDYDEAGRRLAHIYFDKIARKLPPGMFSGKAGALKLLGLGAGGAGSYAFGKSQGRQETREKMPAVAKGAYQKGVKDGARAVIHRLQSMRNG